MTLGELARIPRPERDMVVVYLRLGATLPDAILTAFVDSATHVLRDIADQRTHTLH